MGWEGTENKELEYSKHGSFPESVFDLTLKN